MILFLLAVGAASWSLNALLFHPGRGNWIAGLPDPTVRGGALLGVGVWAGLIGLCALLLAILANLPDLLQALAAMWRPILLTVVAGYLLFANDQGRELGESLIAETGNGPFALLFLVLIYWATNNWHTARIGVKAAIKRKAIPVPRGHETWLFWPPRLLGVCAHLFAAISFSLAAARQSEFADPSHAHAAWAAWAAPFAVVSAAALAWVVDSALLSQRRELDRTRIVWIAVAAVATVLLGGVVTIALRFGTQQEGFRHGTVWISASAVAFLILISYFRRRKPLGPDASPAERKADDRHEDLLASIFTIGLFLVALAFGVATWVSPTAVGGAFGSMLVAYFAFGAILAVVNAIEAAIVWGARKGMFVVSREPRVIGRYVIAFVLCVGVLNAWLHPFHRVRLCDGACEAPPTSAAAFPRAPAFRPTVADAADVWYAQAKENYQRAHGDHPVPMVIVAAAGGGIRAAYWTATVLDALESKLQTDGGVRPYLFAISGVSGGSVGATAFQTSLLARDESKCVGAECRKATRYLKADFLAPALASLVFVDSVASFLPDLGHGDRGTALEQSFENASGGLMTRPFLSLFPYTENKLGGEQARWRPILLLNATHEETGNRIITAHVKIERDVFIDSFDALDVVGDDVRASTAAHNSARFSYVSPAGDLGGDRGSMIDGGYFENYGALTALELARAAEYELNVVRKMSPRVRPVIVMISSDPGLRDAHELVRLKRDKQGGKCVLNVARPEGSLPTPSCGAQLSGRSGNYQSICRNQVENAWLNELLAPLEGVMKVREAHGNRAAAELALLACAETRCQAGAAGSAPGAGPDCLEQVAAPLVDAQLADPDDKKSFEADPDRAYFAHFAMCTTDDVSSPTPPVQPPLGWVLSEKTRDGIDDLLYRCDNPDQMNQLMVALGAGMKAR